MNTQSFSIFKAIDFGFRMFACNIWLILGLLLVGLAVRFGANVITNIIIHQSGLPSCFTAQELSPIKSEEGYQISEQLKNPFSVSINSVYSPDKQESNIGFTYALDLGNFKIIYSKLEDALEVRVGDIIYSSYKGSYAHMVTCIKQHLFLFLLLLLVSLLGLIFGYILFMGWNRIALDIYDRGTSEFKRVFLVVPLFFTYLITGVLYVAIVAVGSILLIIPGIIWGIKYSFFDLIIIDTGCGPIEALRKSGQLTYGHKWKLFWFTLIYWFITMLSVITIIGPFILASVFFLSRAYIYRTLQGVKKTDEYIASELT